MKTYIASIMSLMFFLGYSNGTKSQNSFSSAPQSTIAVLAIESSNLTQSAEELETLTRIKLQAIPNVTVSRHYDVMEHFASQNIDPIDCMSTKCMVREGKSMGVDLILTGNIVRFGERIVIHMSLIDVNKGEVFAADQNEYYNLGSELEGMIEISLNNLFDLESDEMLRNSLENSTDVINSHQVERINLTGPRMGIGYIGGLQGQRLMDPKSENGFGMLPFMTQFGYQFEWQYMSAGNMQALIEFVPLISGMDQGKFIPSITLMNGFRHSRTGWEFAFGPTFRLNQTAEGYYDDNKVWRRASYWAETQADENGNVPDNPFNVHENIDSKGNYSLVYGFTLAAGKTFKSGHLNMPVNVYVTPNFHGVLVGASFGFNVRKRSKNI